MKSKGSFYIGTMLLLLGFLFLLVNVSGVLFPRWEIVSMARLWPLLIIWVGLGFFLPIAIWWENRDRIYGLAMPGTVILVQGLVLLYCSLTGDWNAWAYLWTMAPLSVALGLLALYALGARSQALLITALAIAGASLAVFSVLVSAMGGMAGGIIGAFMLIILGLILLVRSLLAPSAKA